MSATAFADAVFTLPVMFSMVGVGLALGVGSMIYNTMRPVGVLLDGELPDEDAAQRAGDRLLFRRMIMVLGLLLVVAGMFGVVVIQLETTAELFGSGVANAVLSISVVVTGVVLMLTMLAARRP